MDICKIVGSNLKQARKFKGITQKEIANELNKYQSDYSEYEKNMMFLFGEYEDEAIKDFKIINEN